MRVVVESVTGFPRDYRLGAHASVIFKGESGTTGIRVSVTEDRDGRLLLLADRIAGAEKVSRYESASFEVKPAPVRDQGGGE